MATASGNKAGSFNGTYPQYATPYIFWSYDQSIPNNNTVLTATLKVKREKTGSATNKTSTPWSITIGGTKTSGTISFKITNVSAGEYITIGSASKTISHNSDGSCSSVSISATIDISGTTLGTGSVSTSVKPTTIPRASTPTLSASSVAMGSSVTITTNRASDSFTHTLTYSFGSASGTIASSVGASTTWTPPLSLASQIPSATSGTCTITCQTYSGSTLIGIKTVTLTLTVPSSVVPSISSIALSAGNSTVPSSWGVYVQGKSALKVVTTASGSYGSTIKSYKITGIDNNTYYSSNFTSSILQSSGTKTITVTVTDSRGRTATKTTTYTCVAYSNPSVTTATVTRCNSDGTANEEGTYVKYSFKASVASVSSKNTYSYKLGYKNSTSSSYTYITISNSAYTLDKSNVVISGVTFSVDNSYDFQFLVTDYFTSTSVVKNIGTGFTLMDFRSTGKGMAIGKVSEGDYFDVGMNTKIRGDLTVTGDAQARTKIVSVCGSDTAGTAGWYKVASQTMSGYGNTNILYYIKAGYSSGYYGLLELEMRSNSTNIQCWKCEWAIRSGFSKDHVRIVISGMTWTLYVYNPSSQYGRVYFSIIQHGGIRGEYRDYPITHYNSSSPETTSPTASFTTTDLSVKSVLPSTRNTTDTWIPVCRSGYLEYTLRRFYNSTAHTNYPNEQDNLATMEFLSFWNGAYNSNGSSNLSKCSGGTIQAKPVVAYSNASGTTGTVTLSVSAANYTHIRISYKNTDGQIGSTTFSGTSNAQGTTYGTIIRKNGADGAIMINSALFNVSGTSITIARNSQANIYFGGTEDKSDSNTLAIIKVELWN